MNWLPKNAMWFLIAFFGGGLFVLLIKIAFPDNALLAALVAAIVVFALAAYYILNDEDAPEEEGDNVYYLGLLFTLGSLIYTLLRLFEFDADAASNADNVRALIQNFGIALTSTVAGILGRVLVQNMQRAGAAGTEADSAGTVDAPVPAPPRADASSGEIDSFNRQILGRIARDLTQGTNALARFHRIVRSHASETDSRLLAHAETLKKESAEFKDVLQRNADTFVQDLASQTESAIGASAKQAEDLLAQLRSAQDGYLANLRETAGSFHDEIRSASNHSLEALRQNFDTAAKRSLSLAENLSKIDVRVDEALERLGSSLRHASDASAALGDSAQNSAKSAAGLESEIGKLQAVLAEFNAGLTEQTEKAAKLIESLALSVRAAESETRRVAEVFGVLAEEAEARSKSLRRSWGSLFRFWKWKL